MITLVERLINGRTVGREQQHFNLPKWIFKGQIVSRTVVHEKRYRLARMVANEWKKNVEPPPLVDFAVDPCILLMVVRDRTMIAFSPEAVRIFRLADQQGWNFGCALINKKKN